MTGMQRLISALSIRPFTQGASGDMMSRVAYPAGVTGSWAAGLTDQTANTLTDDLTNTTDVVQTVTLYVYTSYHAG